MSTLETSSIGRQQALGSPLDRADGRLKIQGLATYAVEKSLDNLAYAVVVQSTIAYGRITAMHTERARQSPGVLAVYNHESGLTIHSAKTFGEGGAAAQAFLPLQDDKVLWNGQHIALVVAETLEQATEAAALIETEYEQQPPVVHPTHPNAKPETVDALTIDWGDAIPALTQAEVQVGGIYTTPREYNSPIEPHGCIAHWQNGSLTLWEPSQWPGGARQVVSEWLAIDHDKVRVISPFVGGGFGCKGGIQPHSALACVASRELNRPIKLALTRPQTFTAFGGRPRTHQQLALGANRDGLLQAIVHDSWNETALNDVHKEPCNSVTALMYASPNFLSHHKLIHLNTVNPSWMRAPGENPSAFALEVAMDELAWALKRDPLALRLKNYAEQDPQANIPWSSRQLREAYQQGADAFGWSKRPLEPRSLREGRQLIGWGMASGTYPVRRTPGEAQIVLSADGSIEVQSSGVDIGTGTYTILAQTAADVLLVAPESITVSLGDTLLPRAPVAGGSQLANLLTGAVHKTAQALRDMLITLATATEKSPLWQQPPSALSLADGYLWLSNSPGLRISFAELLKLSGREKLVAHQDTFDKTASEEDRNKADRTSTMMLPPTDGGVSAHSWSAIFVEVAVDEDFGTVRVKRMVGAFDSGRVYNPKLAESQWIGGMVMGIGQALLEQGQIDDRDGWIANANLADYLIAVNADIPELTTIDVGKPDYLATVLGGKAVGELGIVGVAAAISNAVWHATGKRIRDLPITQDKLL